jgi:Tol biopolymer transport system component
LALFAPLLGGCGKKPPPPPAPTATPLPPAPQGRIVFTVKENLWVADANGSNLGQITFKTKAWFPSASSSGKLVLFWSPESETVQSLNLTSLDGGSLQRILAPEVQPLAGPARGHFLANPAAFTPDETGLVYAAGNRIWQTDLKGRNPLTLLTLADLATAACPQMSPDGAVLYYVSDQEKPGSLDFAVWKYDIAMRLGTKIMGEPGLTFGTLKLSAQGDKLAYTLSREGKANVGIFPLPAGPRSELTSDGRSYGAAFSPSGSSLLFVRDVPGQMSELHTISLQGRADSVSIPGLFGFAPAWSAAPGPSDEEALLEYELRRKGKAAPAMAASPSASPKK